jgi:hypothetical protein
METGTNRIETSGGADMQRRLLNETNGQRAFALVPESGDAVMSERRRARV